MPRVGATKARTSYYYLSSSPARRRTSTWQSCGGGQGCVKNTPSVGSFVSPVIIIIIIINNHYFTRFGQVHIPMTMSLSHILIICNRSRSFRCHNVTLSQFHVTLVNAVLTEVQQTQRCRREGTRTLCRSCTRSCVGTWSPPPWGCIWFAPWPQRGESPAESTSWARCIYDLRIVENHPWVKFNTPIII